MPSQSRKQLEQWLSTIEVSGSVLDVGGIHLPIKGRTKTWDVADYKILDVKKNHKGYTTDYVSDINSTVVGVPRFDNVFCIEVLSHVWDAFAAVENLRRFTNDGGRLFVSTHFMFPNHQGTDYLRYTKDGIVKILQECGFEVTTIIPKTAAERVALREFSKGECPVDYSIDVIGHLIECKAI